MPAGEGCSRGAGVAQMPSLQRGQPNLGIVRAQLAAVPLGQAPTPGDAQVSWQRLLTLCEPGTKQQRRNVTTGRVLVGILTASTTFAVVSLGPGCSAFPNAVLLPCPRCFPRTALAAQLPQHDTVQGIITCTKHQQPGEPSGWRGAQKTTLSSCVLSHHSVLFRVPKLLSSSSCSLASSTKTLKGHKGDECARFLGGTRSVTRQFTVKALQIQNILLQIRLGSFSYFGFFPLCSYPPTSKQWEGSCTKYELKAFVISGN